MEPCTEVFTTHVPFINLVRLCVLLTLFNYVNFNFFPKAYIFCPLIADLTLTILMEAIQPIFIFRLNLIIINRPLERSIYWRLAIRLYYRIPDLGVSCFIHKRAPGAEHKIQRFITFVESLKQVHLFVVRASGNSVNSISWDIIIIHCCL